MLLGLREHVKPLTRIQHYTYYFKKFLRLFKLKHKNSKRRETCQLHFSQRSIKNYKLVIFYDVTSKINYCVPIITFLLMG